MCDTRRPTGHLLGLLDVVEHVHGLLELEHGLVEGHLGDLVLGRGVALPSLNLQGLKASCCSSSKLLI